MYAQKVRGLPSGTAHISDASEHRSIDRMELSMERNTSPTLETPWSLNLQAYPGVGCILCEHVGHAVGTTRETTTNWLWLWPLALRNSSRKSGNAASHQKIHPEEEPLPNNDRTSERQYYLIRKYFPISSSLPISTFLGNNRYYLLVFYRPYVA
jgi:hypothetical protein